MAIQNDYIEKIEFFTVYPNKEGGNTLLATLLTRDGYRALMYSPSVTEVDADITQSTEWEDLYDIRGIPINRIALQRQLKINGSFWAFKDRHNENEDWYFKVFYLDGPNSKPTVKKEEIEKLFGCTING